MERNLIYAVANSLKLISEFFKTLPTFVTLIEAERNTSVVSGATSVSTTTTTST